MDEMNATSPDQSLPEMDGDRLREECGVFGIFGHPDAAAITALGLHALQHRGCAEVSMLRRWLHRVETSSHRTDTSATRSLIFAMAEKIRIFGENLQQSCLYRYSRESAARSALRQG